MIRGQSGVKPRWQRFGQKRVGPSQYCSAATNSIFGMIVKISRILIHSCNCVGLGVVKTAFFAIHIVSLVVGGLQEQVMER